MCLIKPTPLRENQIYVKVRNLLVLIKSFSWHLEFLFKDKDRAERHELKSRLWLLFSLFPSLLKKRGKKGRRMNSKNRDLSHAFLLNQRQYIYRI